MALFRRRRREGDDTVGRRVVVTEHLEVDESDVFDPDVFGADAPGTEIRDVTGVAGVSGATDATPETSEEIPSEADDGPGGFVRAQTGPFDHSEVEDGLGNRFDLGALWLGAVEGLELRIEIEETDGSVREVRAERDGSAMQVQVFAAPRTTGIWKEIREEIADTVRQQGGQCDERLGPFGTELLTRLPASGADGRVTFQPMRFLGVDGPRWFLRAVLTGPAAADETACEPFLQALRTSVVVRGEEARPPREMLTLALPRQLVEATRAAADGAPAEGMPSEQAPTEGAAEDGPDGLRRRAEDLNPFERGPEITEIR